MPNWKETDRVTITPAGKHALRQKVVTRWYCRVCGEGLPFPECFCYAQTGDCPHAAPDMCEPEREAA
jgi:hypothetical protein